MRAVYEAGPTTYADFAEVIREAKEEEWASQWALRDACAFALDFIADFAQEEFLRYVQEEAGISHQKVKRWAEEARLVPPEERALDKAPGPQIAEARRRAAA